MTAWKRSWLRSLRKYWPMYLMLVPVIAYFLVFKYKPMLFVQIAFKDYKLRKGIWASEWVGLKHFMRFFSSYNFTTTLVNTAVLSGLSLLCCFPFPIFLALLFNELRTDRTKKLVRTITYAPHFISTIVMVGMMIAICSPSTGIVNKILIALGITEDGLYQRQVLPDDVHPFRHLEELRLERHHLHFCHFRHRTHPLRGGEGRWRKPLAAADLCDAAQHSADHCDYADPALR